MVKELTLEFPNFITHVPLSKNKWVKIGYNKIHSSSHYTVRAAFVAAMHSYIEDNIPDNLEIEFPIKSHLTIYVPVNYGGVKRLKNKKTNTHYISWKKPEPDYSPPWDLFNLAAVWLKSLDDVLQKKGILPDDTIAYIQKTTYEYVEIEDLKDRKLVYNLKTIEKKC
jgi:hypothetical protein